MSLELNSKSPQINLKDDVEPVYRFEGFRLDAAHLMLSRIGGEELPLTPKQVETLLALVEHRGEIVGKDALMNRLWPNAFVEESNLIQNIHILRKVLGQTASGKPMIETLRRRGYRFNGQVLRDGPAAQSQPISGKAAIFEFPSVIADNGGTSDTAVSARRSRNWLPVFIGSIALIALSVLIVSYFVRAVDPGSSEPKRSIAVLPLRPIDALARKEMYELGIAHSLIYQLEESKAFIVRPLSAIRKYSDIWQDPIAAGREQKVDYVLASNYQISDGKIRVSSELLNVLTGNVEASFKCGEKDIASGFAMQDEIALEVGNGVLASFSMASNKLIARRGTNNEDAYRRYLDGMYFIDRKSQADAFKAIELFSDAVRLDPNYAKAWAGKAYAHRSAANLGRNVNSLLEYERSRESIDKALALDPNLSEAYSSLCENLYWTAYDFAGAETACRRAIELNPDSSLAHQTYSRFLMGRGRSDEAIAEIKMAIDLEPTSLFNQRLYANCLQHARRYDEAIEQFKRVIELDGEFGTNHYWLSVTYEVAGREAEAYEAWMKYLATQKSDEETVRAFRTAYETSGWAGVKQLRTDWFHLSNEIYFHGAAYNALIGNKDRAFELLDRSLERREWALHLLPVDARLNSLRDDARFSDLIRRL